MTVRWVIAILVVFLAACPAADEVSAQGPTPAPGQQGEQEEVPVDIITGDVELTRGAIQLRRQALVTAAMDLEPRESGAFWLLYREYRADMTRVNDRYVKLLLAYAENYDNLSDQLAGRILQDYLGIERDRTSVKARYLPRFRKVIPVRKVMRFFQVDNKLDAFINADLAAQIPLAR